MLSAIRQSLNRTSLLETDQGESVWAKVHLDDQVHYFCSFYRPPQKPPNELLHRPNQLEVIRQSHRIENPPGMHILGDFNCSKIYYVYEKVLLSHFHMASHLLTLSETFTWIN